MGCRMSKITADCPTVQDLPALERHLERPVKICETDIRRWLSWRGSESENISVKFGTVPYIHTGSFSFDLKG